MEGPNSTQNFSLPYSQPSSPPATPSTGSHPRFHSAFGRTSPIHKPMGFPIAAQSPPLDYIESVGGSAKFTYTPPQFFGISSPSPDIQFTASRASANSSFLDDDVTSGRRTPSSKPGKASRLVEEEYFILEEVSDDEDGSNGIFEVIKPDFLEEIVSEDEAGESSEPEQSRILRGIEKFKINPDSSDDEQARRYRRKKKRWSAGVFKRSHSQSVGSDTDNDDTEALDAHDLGSSARRLRRRVKGPGDRSSLIFEYIPHLNIAEVDEPDEISSVQGPPSLGSDTEEFTLDVLPFWEYQDMDMETDSESSVSSC